MKLNLYEIRLCKKEEYGELIDFIKMYWSENHIFCKSRKIFEFQHGSAENGYYDFIIAVHKSTGEIHAVLGFIRSSLYDMQPMNQPEAIYGALWKVRDDVNNNEIGKLGLGVLYYLIKLFPSSAYITLGLSKFSQQIYEALHFNLTVMNHYYIANPLINEYKIASSPHLGELEGSSVVEIKELDNVPNITNTFYPDKNKEYIWNRYLRHPVYKYELLGIYSAENLLCLWVVRQIEVNGAKCLRLVDMIGTMRAIPKITLQIYHLLERRDCEFIDCYNYGIDETDFLNAGFLKVDSDTVIPNYYEPFERKNVDIHCAYYAKKPVVIFKGDADQDRPNILPSDWIE